MKKFLVFLLVNICLISSICFANPIEVTNIDFVQKNHTIYLNSNDKTNTLTYLETFKQIMETNEQGKAFKYKITYKTDDGVHWDKVTTKVYVKMMLDLVKEL